MRKKILVMLVCAAVLSAAGCGSGAVKSTAADTSQEAGRAVTAEETAPEQNPEEAPEAAEEEEEVNEQAAAATERYESEDGWSVRYNSELVDLEERQESVRFTYNGDAAAVNRIEIRYIPNTSTDIVLADVTRDYDREDLERSEGYFAGQADLWSFNVDEKSDGAHWTHGYTAVEHNGGVLLVEKNGSVESDEERGMLIADTMAAILDSFEFADHEPQEEYDYVPGKYELVRESTETAAETGEKPADAYPSYVVLGENHKGRLGYAEPLNIIWYSRDSLIKEEDSGEPHYFHIEGESFYLQMGEKWVEYRKDLGAATNIESTSVSNKKTVSYRTYENEDGWMVYYDREQIYVREDWDKVNFIYGGESGTDMMQIRYIEDDTTDSVLADETRSFEVSQVTKSEGYVGGGKDAWGFTVTVPASESGSGLYRKLTAVEHNGGVLLFDRVTAAEEDNAYAAKTGKAFEEVISTFMFTDHDPQEEYDYIPGKYMLNDKRLQQNASNYPSYVRLNNDHTGLLGWADEKEIVWYSREGIIKEAADGGAAYFYTIEGDTLYLQIGDEQVEFNKKDSD